MMHWQAQWKTLAPLRAGLDTSGVGAICMTQKVAAFVESLKSVIWGLFQVGSWLRRQ